MFQILCIMFMSYLIAHYFVVIFVFLFFFCVFLFFKSMWKMNGNCTSGLKVDLGSCFFGRFGSSHPAGNRVFPARMSSSQHRLNNPLWESPRQGSQEDRKWRIKKFTPDFTPRRVCLKEFTLWEEDIEILPWIPWDLLNHISLEKDNKTERLTRGNTSPSRAAAYECQT